MNTRFKLSNVTAIFSRFAYGDRIRPTRDWFALLIVSGVLILVSAGFNVWFFFHVTSETQDTAQIAPQTTPSSTSVESVSTLFERRSQEESRYVTQYHFIDPSGSGR